MISLGKFTAVASLVTVPEMTSRAMAVRSATGATMQVLLLILVLYFALSLAITFAMGRLEKWAGSRYGATSGGSDAALTQPTGAVA
jgi:ABC-type amino acid transport system permease subunit